MSSPESANGLSPGASPPPARRVAWVIAAGPDAALPAWPWLPRPDFVVAADGGLVHAQALGLAPVVALGDFDSISPEALAAYTTAHPATDVRRYVHESSRRRTPSWACWRRWTRARRRLC